MKKMFARLLITVVIMLGSSIGTSAHAGPQAEGPVFADQGRLCFTLLFWDPVNTQRICLPTTLL